MLRLLSLAMMIAVTVRPAAAQDPFGPGPGMVTGEDLVPVRFVADRDVVHAGETFHVAAIFDIEPKWHIYWMNPGMAGLPTEVEMKAPDGYAVKPML
jgi:thiol:disulfide interchange protein DsbD